MVFRNSYRAEKALIELARSSLEPKCFTRMVNRKKYINSAKKRGQGENIPSCSVSTVFTEFASFLFRANQPSLIRRRQAHLFQCRKYRNFLFKHYILCKVGFYGRARRDNRRSCHGLINRQPSKVV